MARQMLLRLISLFGSPLPKFSFSTITSRLHRFNFNMKLSSFQIFIDAVVDKVDLDDVVGVSHHAKAIRGSFLKDGILLSI